jgi:hypothetical protein
MSLPAILNLIMLKPAGITGNSSKTAQGIEAE